MVARRGEPQGPQRLPSVAPTDAIASARVHQGSGAAPPDGSGADLGCNRTASVSTHPSSTTRYPRGGTNRARPDNAAMVVSNSCAEFSTTKKLIPGGIIAAPDRAAVIPDIGPDEVDVFELGVAPPDSRDRWIDIDVTEITSGGPRSRYRERASNRSRNQRAPPLRSTPSSMTTFPREGQTRCSYTRRSSGNRTSSKKTSCQRPETRRRPFVPGSPAPSDNSCSLGNPG